MPSIIGNVLFLLPFGLPPRRGPDPFSFKTVGIEGTGTDNGSVDDGSPACDAYDLIISGAFCNADLPISLYVVP